MVGITVSNSGTSDARFLHNWFEFVDISQFANVSTVPSITGSRLKRESILLPPPLPEQRAIAAVLDSIHDAIERTEAVIAATERLRDALLHELLTRGVPGWHTEWKDAPGIGTMPADWEVVRLGDVLESTTYGTNAPLNEVGTTPVFDPNEQPSVWNIGSERRYSERSADLSKKESDYLNLVPGDILFNRTNSLSPSWKGRHCARPTTAYFVRILFVSAQLRVREILASDPLWLSALLWAPNYQSRIERAFRQTPRALAKRT